MKFEHSTATDKNLCESLNHEFLRCHDSFKDFEVFATLTVTKGPDKRLSYRAYNAYTRFLHHLYEFMLAAYCRERGDTRRPRRRAATSTAMPTSNITHNVCSLTLVRQSLTGLLLPGRILCQHIQRGFRKTSDQRCGTCEIRFRVMLTQIGP